MFSLPALVVLSRPVMENTPRVLRLANVNVIQVREFKKKKYQKPKGPCDSCRRAVVDIPKPIDPDCPIQLERPKHKSILQKLKLKLVEGGTNFGTPFRFLTCKEKKKEDSDEKEDKEEVKALVKPKKEVSVVEYRPGVQVTILGAETLVGQYLALMLKQCPGIKKLRLYDAKPCKTKADICELCARDTYKVAQDLQTIDTNCVVQAFSATCNEIDMSLQSADIVVMLESSYVNINQPFMNRFLQLAPTVKYYADAIARECPKAFIVVCTSPIDCMVPLVAETLKETGFYDKRKLIGSIAVPEMRASTLAARALHLEPRYTRVPCVGGTEGDTLVPLFSKAVSDFDFARHNAEFLTNTVRLAPWDVTRCECCCQRSSDLSEAHAVANLVKSIHHALLCQDVPRISGFVETDSSICISPARYCANMVELNVCGINVNFGLPPLSTIEIDLMTTSYLQLQCRLNIALEWYYKYRQLSGCTDTCKLDGWFLPHAFSERFDDCAYNHVD